MNKKVSIKNWSKFDKKTISLVLGMVAFCGALTALHLKEKDYKHALFQGTCMAINASYAAKMILKAQKSAKEQN